MKPTTAFALLSSSLLTPSAFAVVTPAAVHTQEAADSITQEAQTQGKSAGDS